MRYIEITVILATFLLLGVLPGVTSEEPSSGIISGRLTNGTHEDRPASQLEVMLFAVSADKIESVQKTLTDREGTFVFPEQSIEPELSFTAAVDYQGVRYFSSTIRLGPESPSGELAIRVFDKSTDPSTLRISSHHLIIEGSERDLSIKEMIFIKNEALYTYVSEDTPALRFHLPSGASNLSIGGLLNEEEIKVEADAILISSPVRPDGQEITYRYDLMQAGSRLMQAGSRLMAAGSRLMAAGSHQLQYILGSPTEQFDVFLSVPGASLTSENLANDEAITIKEIRYQRLTGQDLAAGAVLTLNIKMSGRGVEYSVQIALILGALFIAVAALAFPFLRRRPAGDMDPQELLMFEKDKLIEEIAQLDTDLKQGNAEEAENRSVRETKKQRVLALSHQLEQEDSREWDR